MKEPLASSPSNAALKSLILPLTSVRILAAGYVVLLHCYLWTSGFDVTTWFGRFIRNGYTAVGFFFCLSGYILAHVYLNTKRRFDRRSFWTARFARVYPLMFASLLLDIPRDLYNHLAHQHPLGLSVLRTTANLVAESLLLQAWLPVYFLGLNGPSWSLSCEGFFYFVFPFVAFWVWSKKGSSAVWLFLTLWVLAMAGPTLVTISHPRLFQEIPGSALQLSTELMPPFRIFEFLAGVTLYAFQNSVISVLPDNLRNRYGYTSLALGIALFCLCIQYSNHVPLLVMSNGFLLPVYALIILGLSNIQGWLQHILSSKICVVLGESSYAVYLLHWPLFAYMLRGRDLTNPLFWMIYVVGVLLISIASFYLVERPARKKILAWMAIRPAVPLEQEKATSGGTPVKLS